MKKDWWKELTEYCRIKEGPGNFFTKCRENVFRGVGR